MDFLPEKGYLLFDGGMGTYLAQKYRTGIRLCEFENLRCPEHVYAVHREYIAAGAEAIKTNTFSANTAVSGEQPETVGRIIEKGCEIALSAAKGMDVRVFASVGPIGGDDEAAVREEYRRIAARFLSCGVNRFLFETFSDYRDLIFCARMIKRMDPFAAVIAECTVSPDRYTKSGVSAQEVLDALAAVPEVDACGFNCTSGPLHMAQMAESLDFHGKAASFMPNAGYPIVVGGRTVFDTRPDYFAEYLVKIRGCGARVLGGCCGTTPAHIARAAQLLRQAPPVRAAALRPFAPIPRAAAEERAAKKQIAVELDSPLDADLASFFRAAGELNKAGADLITIADSPIGRARADSSILAVRLVREYGILAMPHLNCRDRNLNATKALLLGLCAAGVRDVLAVTGDSIPSSDRDEIRSVFHFNSVRLASFIRSLNGTVFSAAPFRIAAALNVNVPNFGPELEKALRKQEAGVTSFLTQPVFTERAAENLCLAKERLSAALLGGILPVVSYKNGMFLNNEVAGISIPDALLERYRGATREESARIAVETSLALARRVAAFTDGYYIMTPLRRTDIVCEIVTALQKEMAEPFRETAR